MHSTEEQVFRTSPKATPPAPRRAGGRHRQSVPTPSPFTVGDEAQRIRRIELIQKHRDLDDTVTKLSETAACDELLIARLKKRKLLIKDAIARIEALLSAGSDQAGTTVTLRP